MEPQEGTTPSSTPNTEAAPQQPAAPAAAPETTSPSAPETAPDMMQQTQAPVEPAGKRPMWQWLLIYIIIAGIIYILYYFLFGGSDTASGY